MRAKTKVVSFVFCALVLAFGATAQAQVIHDVTQQNNEVVQYGLTELMGEVRFTAAAVCTPGPCTTIASTITITYNGAAINNLPSAAKTYAGGVLTYANGIELTLTGQYAVGFGATDRVSLSAINTALGGQIILTVQGGFVVAAGDQIRVNGARTDVSAKTVGTTIAALISSAPSNANTFNSVNVTVATVNRSMTVDVTGVTIPICITPANPTFRVTEGFATAFVEYTSPGAGARTRFGATGDTRVRIQVNNLPSGVTLSWPTTVAGSSTSGAATGATLVLESGSTSSVAIYTFNTTNQATSDTLQEYFNVIPVVSVAATAAFGQSTAQAQLWPDASSTTIIRFAHPLINDPANNFIAVNRCVTYLLFPFVTGNNIPGFTTGMAIANTSSDDAVFVTAGGVTASRTAAAQAGAITLFGWHNSNKDATGSSTTTFTPSTFTGAAVSAVVSANLSAGDSWSGVIDGAAGFAGFQGYVIAKCDFQYAHGFSFIVGKYNSGTVFDVAHGYLALVIPDPSITVRNAANGGETLGQ
jgi:hypothetical protein